MSFKDMNLFEAELESGIASYECQECGRMNDGLRRVTTNLQAFRCAEARVVTREISGWTKMLLPPRYASLACEHCFMMIALDAFTRAFPPRSNWHW